MPETGTAFLVDPMGHAPDALDEKEFEHVRRLVDILRDDNNEPLQDAVEWLLRRSVDVPAMDDPAILGTMVWNYANEHPHETYGVLARCFGENVIEDLSEDELETLQQAVIVLRTEGWFPAWLKLQFRKIATGTLPDDRYPTPLTIGASLVDCIREHEERMEAARDMVRMRPDLLFPAAAEPQTTPEPPAAPDVDQVRKRTTGHSRAPKAGKKVEHA